MKARRFIGRVAVLTTGMAFLAVGVALGSGHVRQLNRQVDTLRNLQGLAEGFASRGPELPGYPFSSSDEAVRALVEAGHLTHEEVLSRTNGRSLVLAPAMLNAPTPDDVQSSVAIDPGTIVAYEPLPADDASHACLLFADGHGACVPAEKHDAMVKPVAANR